MRDQLKTLVRGAYDIQKLRIQMGNRVVANFKAKLGQMPSLTEEDTIDNEGKELLKKLRRSYDKVMDGVVDFPKIKKFKGDEIISAYTELCLVHQYMDLQKSEDFHFGRLKSVLKEFDVYNHFLKDIKGVGPAMAGVIIGEIDIHQCKYASSLWKYCGLDVAEDGKGRSRKKEHLREYEYADKEGEIQTKMGITFNPFLKTKLIGVLGSAFLRAGESKYSNVYYDYKSRLENHKNHIEKSKGHRHNMATRYMVKIFLADLYAEWRNLEGLDVAVPYSEAKLGMKKHTERPIKLVKKSVIVKKKNTKRTKKTATL